MNSQKNFITIHGCPSDAEKAINPATRTYGKHWIPWLKRNLLAAGFFRRNARSEGGLVPFKVVSRKV